MGRNATTHVKMPSLLPGLRFPECKPATKAHSRRCSTGDLHRLNFLYDVRSMLQRKRFRLRLPERILTLGDRTLVMGVLNVTPDSFSDGGAYLDSEMAIARGLELERDGADILDIGGESTRPGASPISAEEQLRRILPVIRALHKKLKIPISVDTRSANVAAAALAAGAEIVNDVSGLRTDAQFGAIAGRANAAWILMHMRGTPQTMQKGPFARDVIRDTKSGLRAAMARAKNSGIPKTQLLVDPGIGFGKSHEQNFEILARLPGLASLGCPIVIGTSRKAFLGKALAKSGQPAVPPDARLLGTAATVTAAILGGAHIVRVHDVAEMAGVARIADSILNSGL
jgi:dihydropteroate synthase